MNAATFNKTFDALTLLKDAGAVTSSGAGTVAAAARVIDLAGDPSGTSIPPTAGMAAAPDTPAECLIDITACDATDGNETYAVNIEGSTTVGFSGGSQQILAQIPIARGTTGRFLLPFSGWQNDVYFRYIRVNHVLGGTTPSINYVARLGKAH